MTVSEVSIQSGLREIEEQVTENKRCGFLVAKLNK